MTNHETLQKYFASIHSGGWESYVAEKFTFTNVNLDNVSKGKEAYLKGAGAFFKATTAVDVKQMIMSDNNVAVLARYTVCSPRGDEGVCDVAEFITLEGGKLIASTIIFDTQALIAFMSGK